MSELQLLVGLIGAVGLALLIGTVAALVTYRRTGIFPGWPDDPDGRAPDPSTRVRAVIARAVVGAIITVVAVLVIVALPPAG